LHNETNYGEERFPSWNADVLCRFHIAIGLGSIYFKYLTTERIMMNLQEFYTIPENREVLKLICQTALEDVDPEEAEISSAFLDPLIDMEINGELDLREQKSEAFGLGGGEIVAAAIGFIAAPMVNEFSKKRGEQLAVVVIGKIKQQCQQKEEREKRIREITQDINYPPDPKKRRQIIEAVFEAMCKFSQKYDN